MKSTDNKKARSLENKGLIAVNKGILTMSSLALSFNEVNFSPVQQDGQIWIASRELGQALGYSREDAVNKIFERNSDEFTVSMARNVKLTLQGQAREVRVFSLRGCHLIAMLSRTAIAKQFRKWVLDVLDREVVTKQLEGRQSISPEQKDTLHKIVDHKVNGNQGLRAQVWTRHNRHFKINSYHELLAIHFEDAVKYLLEMEVKQRVEKEEVKTLPYPQEVIQVAQQISQEFNNSKYDSWHVSARNGVLTAMPLPPGFYPTMDIAEFTKRFDSVLDLLYGTDTLRVGRHMLAEMNKNP